MARPYDHDRIDFEIFTALALNNSMKTKITPIEGKGFYQPKTMKSLKVGNTRPTGVELHFNREHCEKYRLGVGPSQVIGEEKDFRNNGQGTLPIHFEDDLPNVSDGKGKDNVSYDECTQDVPGDGCTLDVPGDGCTQDVPGGRCAQDVPGGRCAQDVPGDRCAQDVPGGRCTQDVAGDGGAQDMPGDGGAQYMPGDGNALDVLGDGCTEDVLGDGCTHDVPGDGCALDVPGDGNALDMPGDGHAQDMPGDGCAKHGIRVRFVRWLVDCHREESVSGDETTSSDEVSCLDETYMIEIKTFPYFPRFCFLLKQSDEENVELVSSEHNISTGMVREMSRRALLQFNRLSQGDREHPSDSGKILNRKGPDQERYKRPGKHNPFWLTCSESLPSSGMECMQRPRLKPSGVNSFRYYTLLVLFLILSNFNGANCSVESVVSSELALELGTQTGCDLILYECPRTERGRKFRELCHGAGKNCSEGFHYHCGADKYTGNLVEGCYKEIVCSPGSFPQVVHIPSKNVSILECTICDKDHYQPLPMNSSDQLDECSQKRLSSEVERQLSFLVLVEELWPIGADKYACDAKNGYSNLRGQHLCDVTSPCFCTKSVTCRLDDGLELLPDGTCDTICFGDRNPLLNFTCMGSKAELITNKGSSEWSKITGIFVFVTGFCVAQLVHLVVHFLRKSAGLAFEENHVKETSDSNHSPDGKDYKKSSTCPSYEEERKIDIKIPIQESHPNERHGKVKDTVPSGVANSTAALSSPTFDMHRDELLDICHIAAADLGSKELTERSANISHDTVENVDESTPITMTVLGESVLRSPKEQNDNHQMDLDFQSLDQIEGLDGAGNSLMKISPFNEERLGLSSFETLSGDNILSMECQSTTFQTQPKEELVTLQFLKPENDHEAIPSSSGVSLSSGYPDNTSTFGEHISEENESDLDGKKSLSENVGPIKEIQQTEEQVKDEIPDPDKEDKTCPQKLHKEVLAISAKPQIFSEVNTTQEEGLSDSILLPKKANLFTIVSTLPDTKMFQRTFSIEIYHIINSQDELSQSKCTIKLQSSQEYTLNREQHVISTLADMLSAKQFQRKLYSNMRLSFRRVVMKPIWKHVRITSKHVKMESECWLDGITPLEGKADLSYIAKNTQKILWIIVLNLSETSAAKMGIYAMFIAFYENLNWYMDKTNVRDTYIYCFFKCNTDDIFFQRKTFTDLCQARKMAIDSSLYLEFPYGNTPASLTTGNCFAGCTPQSNTCSVEEYSQYSGENYVHPEIFKINKPLTGTQGQNLVSGHRNLVEYKRKDKSEEMEVISKTSNKKVSSQSKLKRRTCKTTHRKFSNTNPIFNDCAANVRGETRGEDTPFHVRKEGASSFAQSLREIMTSMSSIQQSWDEVLQSYSKISEVDNCTRDELVKEIREKEDEIMKSIDNILEELRSPRFMADLRNWRYFKPEVMPLACFPVLKEYFERLEQGPISHEESMIYEWLRLASLNTYCGAASAIQLARNGFYHDVEQGPTATRCHACKLLKTNWEFFDNIAEEHQRLSPNCRLHQAGTSGNVSIDNQPERNAPEVTEEEPVDRNTTPEVNESSEHARNEVANITENLQGTQIPEMIPKGPQQPTEDRYNHEFTSWSTPRTVSGQETSSGPPEGTGRAHQQNTGASVGAQDSNNTATNITVTSENSSSQRPRTQVATSTPFATGAGKLRERNQGNGGFSAGDASQGVNDPSHVNVLDPKYGEYSSVDSRAASFTSMWPSYLDQTPRQMAQAGFFYAGVADFTRCFACGGGLRNWEAGDDPCLEHTRWYPRCEYMNKLKGSVYVQAVIRRQEEHAAEQRRRQQQQRRQQTPSNTPPDPLTTPAAAVLIEMGYTSERAREAILAVRRNTGHNSVSAEQALVWILDRDELSELTASEAPTATQPTVTTTRQSSATAFNQTSTSTQGSSSATQISSASSQTSSTTVTSASGGSSKGLESNKQGQGALVTGATGGSRSSTPTRSGSNSRGDSKSENKPGEKDSQKKGANGQGNQPSGKQKKKNGKKKGKGGGAGNNGGEADANEEKVSESVVEETVNEGGAMAIKGNNSREMVSAGEPTEKDTSTLKAENKKLREMQTCKICMDKPVNMTLLPCGHLVCCESCSPHLRKCPICRRRIEGSVKTFMS